MDDSGINRLLTDRSYNQLNGKKIVYIDSQLLRYHTFDINRISKLFPSFPTNQLFALRSVLIASIVSKHRLIEALCNYANDRLLEPPVYILEQRLYCIRGNQAPKNQGLLEENKNWKIRLFLDKSNYSFFSSPRKKVSPPN